MGNLDPIRRLTDLFGADARACENPFIESSLSRPSPAWMGLGGIWLDLHLRDTLRYSIDLCLGLATNLITQHAPRGGGVYKFPGC